MRVSDVMAVEDIAAELGLKSSTVRGILRNALHKLRRRTWTANRFRELCREARRMREARMPSAPPDWSY